MINQSLRLHTKVGVNCPNCPKYSRSSPQPYPIYLDQPNKPLLCFNWQCRVFIWASIIVSDFLFLYTTTQQHCCATPSIDSTRLVVYRLLAWVWYLNWLKIKNPTRSDFLPLPKMIWLCVINGVSDDELPAMNHRSYRVELIWTGKACWWDPFVVSRRC